MISGALQRLVQLLLIYPVVWLGAKIFYKGDS